MHRTKCFGDRYIGAERLLLAYHDVSNPSGLPLDCHLSFSISTLRLSYELVMKRLTISNRTSDVVSLDAPFTPELRISVLPGASATISVPRLNSSISAYRSQDEKHSKESDPITIHAPLKLGASWRAAVTDKGCPWAMYRSRVRHNTNNVLIMWHHALHPQR